MTPYKGIILCNVIIVIRMYIYYYIYVYMIYWLKTCFGQLMNIRVYKCMGSDGNVQIWVERGFLNILATLRTGHGPQTRNNNRYFEI